MSWTCYKDWSQLLQHGLGIGRWPPGFDEQRWNGSDNCDQWESFAARNCTSRGGLHKTLTCSMYFNKASEANRSRKYHHFFKLFVGVHSRHTSQVSQNIPVFWGKNAHQWEKNIDRISSNAYPTYTQICTGLGCPNQTLYLIMNTSIQNHSHDAAGEIVFFFFKLCNNPRLNFKIRKKECKISQSCDPDCGYAFNLGIIHVHSWCLKLLRQALLTKCSLKYNLSSCKTCKIWKISIPYFTKKARYREVVDMLWKTFPVATDFQFIVCL